MELHGRRFELTCGTLGLAILAFGTVDITLKDRFKPYEISMPNTFLGTSSITSTIRNAIQGRDVELENLCLLPHDLSVYAVDREDAEAGLRALSDLGLIKTVRSVQGTYSIAPGRWTSGVGDAAVKVFTMQEELSCERPMSLPYLLLFFGLQFGVAAALFWRHKVAR